MTVMKRCAHRSGRTLSTGWMHRFRSPGAPAVDLDLAHAWFTRHEARLATHADWRGDQMDGEFVEVNHG